MPRIELPSGGWAVIQDGNTVNNGQRKAFLLAASDVHTEGVTQKETVASGFALTDDMFKMFILDWSFGPIAEISTAALDALVIADYDAIAEVVYGLVRIAFPDMGVTPDPKAPTTNLEPSPSDSKVVDESPGTSSPDSTITGETTYSSV